MDDHLGADEGAGEIVDGRRPEMSAVANLPEHQTPRDLDSADFDRDAALSSGTALLVVTLQSDELTLTFHYQGKMEVNSRSTVDLRKNLKSIPEITQKARSLQGQGAATGAQHMPWRDAYFQASGMWRYNQDLMLWTNRLLAAEGPRRLIVKDGTSLGIPWELYFQHEVDDGPNATQTRGWLGALIPVVRWVDLLNSRLTDRGEADRKDSVAGMIALESDGLPKLAGRFDRFLVEPRTGDMDTLISWLEGKTDSFGFVMMRCHGVHGAETKSHKLCQIGYDQYDHFDYSALARNEALVFLNACVGAVPSGQASDLPITFSELFLHKGASGVIAATDDIDVDQSQDLAEDLLTASEHGPVNIAEWLLGWRSDYAENAEQDSRRVRFSSAEKPAGSPETLVAFEETFKRFFEAFKFVYFGHVGSTLQAIPTVPDGRVA
jgi:hypothetical protein